MKLKIPQHIMFKLQAWRDMGDTEVTGFFVTEQGSINEVIDAVIIKAECSMASVDISAESLEKMYFDMTEKGIYPAQLQIWWHTHPGNSASPSGTDQTTFAELGQDRARNIMYILAKGGEEFAQVSVTDLDSGLMLKSDMGIEHPFTKWQAFPGYDELKKQYSESVIKPDPVIYNGYHYGNNYGYEYGYHRTRNAWEKKDTITEANQKFINKVNKQSGLVIENENDLDKRTEIEKELFKLTSEEFAYMEELNDMVEAGGITAQAADALALNEGYGWEFYTNVYSTSSEPEEFDDDTILLTKTDPDYILMENLWKDAATCKVFLSQVESLIESTKLNQENANLYLSQNQFNVCYIDGDYVDT